MQSRPQQGTGAPQSAARQYEHAARWAGRKGWGDWAAHPTVVPPAASQRVAQPALLSKRTSFLGRWGDARLLTLFGQLAQALLAPVAAVDAAVVEHQHAHRQVVPAAGAGWQRGRRRHEVSSRALGWEAGRRHTQHTKPAAAHAGAALGLLRMRLAPPQHGTPGALSSQECKADMALPATVLPSRRLTPHSHSQQPPPPPRQPISPPRQHSGQAGVCQDYAHRQMVSHSMPLKPNAESPSTATTPRSGCTTAAASA